MSAPESTGRVPDFCVGFHPDRPIGEVADLAAEAERLGFPGVWVADSQSLFRDVYATLALVADRTQRIRLGTGVTNPVTRHPAVIAGAIGSVAEHAAGREVRLGIGTGETAVESIGRKRATIKRMEDTARVIHALHAGETVEYEEAQLRLDWPSPRVPVVFASSGPKSLTAAGRSADGVYLKLGIHPEVLAYALQHVAAGRSEAGKTMEGFHVQAMLPVAVNDDDPAAARDEVRGFAAAIARAAVRAIPAEDLPEELGGTIAELERVSSEARARQSYVEWLHSPEYARMIPDVIVDAFAIAGTAEEVATRIAALGAHGITEVIAPLTMPDPWPTLRAIGEGVLPRLAEARA
jgi:5,10-methylenetetrahydromethanopterin reductase